METSVITPQRGRLAVIEAEADIRRFPEDVFDYASAPAHELQWNIRMKRLEKLTDRPVGVGARYRMEFTQGPPATSECVRFERPSLWELVGGSKIITSSFRGRVVPEGDGTHLVLRMEIRLRGLLELALPLVRRRMEHELGRDIATIKARLEGGGGVGLRRMVTNPERPGAAPADGPGPVPRRGERGPTAEGPVGKGAVDPSRPGEVP
jgi:uncharacterized protein YndB with AHSA1/START domain